MNEITKSILRRVDDASLAARVSQIEFPQLEITEQELKSIICDMQHWPKAYAFMIEGVKIKVLWKENHA